MLRSLEGELVDENIVGIDLTCRIVDRSGERHVGEAARRASVGDTQLLVALHVNDALIVVARGTPPQLTVDATLSEAGEAVYAHRVGLSGCCKRERRSKSGTSDHRPTH